MEVCVYKEICIRMYGVCKFLLNLKVLRFGKEILGLLELPVKIICMLCCVQCNTQSAGTKKSPRGKTRHVLFIEYPLGKKRGRRCKSLNHFLLYCLRALRGIPCQTSELLPQIQWKNYTDAHNLSKIKGRSGI